MQDITQYKYLSDDEKFIADQIHGLLLGRSVTLLSVVAIDTQTEYLVAAEDGADLNMIQDDAIDAANERA